MTRSPSARSSGTTSAGSQPKSLARPGVGHQHDRLHGLPRPLHGAEGSVRLPEAIRSRANARAGLAALSDERLAEDDSSTAATHARQVTIAFLNRKGGAGNQRLSVLFRARD